MFGAIIGDIVGSRFEGKTEIPEDFEFFHENSHFTDDTVQTIAVADAILQSTTNGTSLKEEAIKNLQEYGRRYLWCGCGDMFYKWLFQENPQPYESYGNGAAMRISPVALASKYHWEAICNSRTVTGITHNHPESYKGADATVTAIWMAKRHRSKKQIRNAVQMMHRITIPDYTTYQDTKFNANCLYSVKAALSAFMESESFEACIRKAVLIGGDTDTIAAIAGSIAGPFYGIPEEMKEVAKEALDDYLQEKLEQVMAIQNYSHYKRSPC